MKLYAATDKDGNIMIAYPSTQFHNEQSLTLKELHTYDPASQAVVSIGHLNVMRQEINDAIGYINSAQSWIDKFLSSGKEAT